MKKELCPFDGFKLCVYNNQDYIDYLIRNAAQFSLVEKKVVDGHIFDYPKTGDYKGLKLKIHLTRKGLTVTISGSFHKFNNPDKTNANQFYWEDFTKAYHEIAELLKLPAETQLVNLEVGFNLEIPIEWELTATQILKSIFFIQKISTRGTKSIKCLPNNGYSIHHKTEDYEYKIYDKGKQYRLKKEILRYEKKFIKSRAVNRIGYQTYCDLLSFDKLNIPIENLIRDFKKLIIYNEQLEKSEHLTEEEKEFLLQIKKIDFFEDFKGTKEQFDQIKGKYLALVETHKCMNIHTQLIDLILKKLNTE